MKHYVLIGFCIVLALSCKKDPPVGPPPTTITLTAEDASCIEAWLKVTATEVPATVRLVRDGQRVSDLRLLTSDSLLVDEGLLPSRTYTYQLHKLAADSTVIETSASVQVTTMDTTSSNWSFTIDTLGVTASVLYDVAIISDTNIWAVGELFLRDSSGALDPRRYNLARWDGTTWTIERLMYQGSPPVLRSIFAFAENDVWLDPWFHWNGQSFQQVPIDPIFIGVGVNKMWGSPDGRLYVVGNGGFIAERSPVGMWRQLESGTGERMTDVWGAGNGKQVWVCGFNDSNGGGIVLRVSNGQSEIIWDRLAPPRPPYIYASYLSSLWSSGSGEVVLVGGRFYRHSLLDIDIVRNEYIYRPDGSSYIFQLGNFAYRVRGSARNNIFLAGDYAMIWHWNGSTWHRYEELLDSSVIMYSLAVTHSEVVAVGIKFNGILQTGIVIRGRR